MAYVLWENNSDNVIFFKTNSGKEHAFSPFCGNIRDPIYEDRSTKLKLLKKSYYCELIIDDKSLQIFFFFCLLKVNADCKIALAF